MDEIAEAERPDGVRDRIREIEDRFRALTEHCTDAIAEISQNRRVVFISRSFTRVFGHEFEDLVGMDVLRLIHADDRERIRQIHSTATVDESISQLLFRLRHKNGTWRWVELTGCAYLTSSGELRAIVINRDVTERVL
ncbi:MAG: PAS domain S-box protein, partial [Myxococcota bacterium]